MKRDAFITGTDIDGITVTFIETRRHVLLQLYQLIRDCPLRGTYMTVIRIQEKMFTADYTNLGEKPSQNGRRIMQITNQRKRDMVSGISRRCSRWISNLNQMSSTTTSLFNRVLASSKRLYGPMCL